MSTMADEVGPLLSATHKITGDNQPNVSSFKVQLPPGLGLDEIQPFARGLLEIPNLQQGFGAGGSSVAQGMNLNLPRNPQLPDVVGGHPLGAFTDDLFEAARAQLAFETARRHADILKQLGYQDPESGQFIPGRVETAASRRRNDLRYQQGLATEDVTGEMQRAGTLFSGYRAKQQARVEHPFVQAMAELEGQVPQQLSDLFEGATDNSRQFVITMNQLLAEAAQRAAERVRGRPVGTGGTGGPSQVFTPERQPTRDDGTPPNWDELFPTLPPDTSPTGQYGAGLFGAAPELYDLTPEQIAAILAKIPEVVNEPLPAMGGGGAGFFRSA